MVTNGQNIVSDNHTHFDIAPILLDEPTSSRQYNITPDFDVTPTNCVDESDMQVDLPDGRFPSYDADSTDVVRIEDMPGRMDDAIEEFTTVKRPRGRPKGSKKQAKGESTTKNVQESKTSGGIDDRPIQLVQDLPQTEQKLQGHQKEIKNRRKGKQKTTEHKEHIITDVVRGQTGYDMVTVTISPLEGPAVMSQIHADMSSDPHTAIKEGPSPMQPSSSKVRLSTDVHDDVSSEQCSTLDDLVDRMRTLAKEYKNGSDVDAKYEI
ncbi:hypothetical protein JVU11DRAFT_11376 [Chiua virens]|nr:hypothetical protein JVU11DRAFT_11376 [Chiua virens]